MRCIYFIIGAYIRVEALAMESITWQVAEKAARKADQAAATRAELAAINATLEVSASTCARD